jgi:hypothetical protein
MLNLRGCDLKIILAILVPMNPRNTDIFLSQAQEISSTTALGLLFRGKMPDFVG